MLRAPSMLSSGSLSKANHLPVRTIGTVYLHPPRKRDAFSSQSPLSALPCLFTHCCSGELHTTQSEHRRQNTRIIAIELPGCGHRIFISVSREGALANPVAGRRVLIALNTSDPLIGLLDRSSYRTFQAGQPRYGAIRPPVNQHGSIMVVSA